MLNRWYSPLRLTHVNTLFKPPCVKAAQNEELQEILGEAGGTDVTVRVLSTPNLRGLE